MDTNNVSIQQIVAFTILMESGHGIINKSPVYIREKFDYCMDESNLKHIEGALDPDNQFKLRQWRETWIS